MFVQRRATGEDIHITTQGRQVKLIRAVQTEKAGQTQDVKRNRKLPTKTKS